MRRRQVIQNLKVQGWTCGTLNDASRLYFIHFKNISFIRDLSKWYTAIYQHKIQIHYQYQRETEQGKVIEGLFSRKIGTNFWNTWDWRRYINHSAYQILFLRFNLFFLTSSLFYNLLYLFQMLTYKICRLDPH